MTIDPLNPEIDKELYSALVDNSILGLAVIQDRKLIYSNNALADITGHTREELSSFSSDNFISLVHPEDRNLVLETVINGLARMQFPLHQEFRVSSGRRRAKLVIWQSHLVNPETSVELTSPHMGLPQEMAFRCLYGPFHNPPGSKTQ